MEAPSAFWNDLVEDLEDAEFLREYVVESIRIATIDSIVNSLDDAREAAGLSKASLARAINADPATMRRLFTGKTSNPTLATLAEVAAALGMRVALEPLSESERSKITQSLLEGRAANAAGLAEYLQNLRNTRNSSTAA